MEALDLLQVYRLLDVAYGSLETSERIRNELIILRRDQLESRKRSTIERALLVGLTLLGGIPVLYSIFPAELVAPKGVWISAFALMAIAYVVVGLLQWRSLSQESKVLEGILDETPHLTEDDPLFLEMQLSTFITRRSLIREIAGLGPSGAMAVNLKGIEAHWGARIDATYGILNELHREGQITNERYEQLLAWREGG
jgi:hypothetical protein